MSEWSDFIQKLEWEGGIVAMLEYGGPEVFPFEAQSAARDLRIALDVIEELIMEHEEEEE